MDAPKHAGWDAFATQTGIRWYDATGGPEIVEGYTGTESAAVALRANYSFGDDAAREQLESILSGETMLRVGALENGALGETTRVDGTRIVDVISLGAEGDVASQLAMGSVLQWEAHRDGEQGGSFDEFLQSGNAQAQMIDNMTQEYGIGVAMANAAIAANYLTWTSTAATGDQAAYTNYLMSTFDNSTDAMRPFVDDRAGTVGIEQSRSPGFLSSTFSDPLAPAGNRHAQGVPLVGSVYGLGDTASRLAFGDQESLFYVNTGERAAPLMLPGEGWAAVGDAFDIASTASGLKSATSIGQAGLVIVGLDLHLPANGSAGELFKTASAAYGTGTTLAEAFDTGSSVLDDIANFLRPQVTDWEGASAAEQTHVILRGIDRALEPIFDGRIVTPRQLGFASDMPEARLDRRVFGMMEHAGIPSVVNQQPGWSVEQSRGAANQIARSYMAVGMLMEGFGVESADLMSYLAYGGPGPLAQFDGYSLGTWNDGFLSDNGGPIDFAAYSTFDYGDLPNSVQRYNDVGGNFGFVFSDPNRSAGYDADAIFFDSFYGELMRITPPEGGWR